MQSTASLCSVHSWKCSFAETHVIHSPAPSANSWHHGYSSIVCPVYQRTPSLIVTSDLPNESKMVSLSLNDLFKRFRGGRKKTPVHHAVQNHSTATGILAVSKPILGFRSFQPSSPNPPRSSVVSVYRNTSDAAQTFLPPVQAVAGAIPGVGGIIKAVIGGMLSTLQLVDVIQFPSRVLIPLALNFDIIEPYPQ